MKVFKKLYPELIYMPVLAVAYFVIRLTNLMSLPIFTDEAIYTRWAQIARFDANWRFISLTDGKQPSFVWIDMVIMKLFKDPLMAGRMVSVAAGFGAMVGLYFLASEVFKSSEKGNNRGRIIGLVASAIFIFFPFSLVYDRMAIYDSLVATFFIWALYFQILLVRRVRFDIAMVTGAVLGGSVLTKSSGFLSIYMIPFLLLIFDFSKKGLRSRFLKFVVYALTAAAIANAMYSFLRLSPFFHIIAEKNNIFVYTIGDWLKFTFISKVSNFSSNSMRLFEWFVTYMTIPYMVLVIVAFIIEKNFLKEKLVLLLWFLLPFLALCVFGKTLYPRYELFMVMPLLPLVSFSIYHLFELYKSIVIRIVLLILIATLPLRAVYYILFDFPHAPIPRLDLEQYINGWPAGGGIEESVNYFKQQAQNGSIYVATQGTFGLLPASYEIYLITDKKITLKGYWPTEANVPDEVLNKAKNMPTYFVFYQDCSLCDFPGAAPTSWPLQKIASYKKGIGNTYLTVYKVKSEQ